MSSLLSIPPAGERTWRFPHEQSHFEARVTLEGSGSARTVLRLLDDRSRTIHTDDRNHEVQGTLEVTFPGVPLPRTGRYTLTLEVTAPGVRQSQQVTIRRGS